ncbi:rho GTPase-activating protein 21 isoform X3 [Notechis scutatus]|uniref:Rho GTPase-activating protein 21 isoform X3 n=1 Tax=Notechis scutatus TaxID=8663 RepID=A0A6J1UAA7_9SAUR|nr:rho GTPase-activating protein 21 isoform X3 [Notechis scutatus]
MASRWAVGQLWWKRDSSAAEVHEKCSQYTHISFPSFFTRAYSNSFPGLSHPSRLCCWDTSPWISHWKRYPNMKMKKGSVKQGHYQKMMKKLCLGLDSN